MWRLPSQGATPAILFVVKKKNRQGQASKIANVLAATGRDHAVCNRRTQARWEELFLKASKL